MYFGQIAYELEIVEERHILGNVRRSTTSAMNIHSARHMNYYNAMEDQYLRKWQLDEFKDLKSLSQW